MKARGMLPKVHAVKRIYRIVYTHALESKHYLTALYSYSRGNNDLG